MKNRILLLILILPLLIGGCKTYDYLNAELENTDASVQSFQEMNFRDLGLGDSLLLVLGETNEVFNFENRKSFYLSYKLPEEAEQYTIEVRSHFSSVAGRFADIAYPTILLLDSSYNIVRKVEEPFGNTASDAFGTPQTTYFPIVIQRSVEEKFVVIFADQKYINDFGSWEYSPPVGVLGPLGAIQAQNKIKFVAGGVIKVILRQNT